MKWGLRQVLWTTAPCCLLKVGIAQAPWFPADVSLCTQAVQHILCPHSDKLTCSEHHHAAAVIAPTSTPWLMDAQVCSNLFLSSLQACRQMPQVPSLLKP